MKNLLLLFIHLMFAFPSLSAVITVDGNGPANYNNIQDAIDSANDGDIIIVQPGFYKENINFLGKNITLTGTSPADSNITGATIIQGNVVFRGIENSNCILTGFKVNARILGFDLSIDPNGDNHTHALIANCILQGNGTCGGNIISACDGTINNCIISDNYTICYSLCPVISGCNGLIKNCTIAGNNSGIEVCEGGHTTIQNCIIYHNWEQRPQISVGKGGILDISYCDLQFGLEGIYLEDTNSLVNWGLGNINADPCFVRTGYWDEESDQLIQGNYYLQSSEGRWNPNINGWVMDANTSICIDAGNPGSLMESEPLPNGNRINMGAYGGTPTASKSPLDWRSIADLTNNGAVNNQDLSVFLSFWLDNGLERPADLDHNGIVNFYDYAIFTKNWLW